MKLLYNIESFINILKGMKNMNQNIMEKNMERFKQMLSKAQEFEATLQQGSRFKIEILFYKKILDYSDVYDMNKYAWSVGKKFIVGEENPTPSAEFQDVVDQTNMTSIMERYAGGRIKIKIKQRMKKGKYQLLEHFKMEVLE